MAKGFLHGKPISVNINGTCEIGSLVPPYGDPGTTTLVIDPKKKYLFCWGHGSSGANNVVVAWYYNAKTLTKIIDIISPKWVNVTLSGNTISLVTTNGAYGAVLTYFKMD